VGLVADASEVGADTTKPQEITRRKDAPNDDGNEDLGEQFVWQHRQEDGGDDTAIGHICVLKSGHLCARLVRVADICDGTGASVRVANRPAGDSSRTDAVPKSR